MLFRSLSFGEGWVFGTTPDRIADRMSSHVLSVAGGNPACFEPPPDIFRNSFESGNTGAWSSTVP